MLPPLRVTNHILLAPPYCCQKSLQNTSNTISQKWYTFSQKCTTIFGFNVILTRVLTKTRPILSKSRTKFVFSFFIKYLKYNALGIAKKQKVYKVNCHFLYLHKCIFIKNTQTSVEQQLNTVHHPQGVQVIAEYH